MWIKTAAVTLALALLLSGCGFVSMDGAPPILVDGDDTPQLPMPDILPNRQAFYFAPDVSQTLFQFELLQYDIDSGEFIYSYESEQMMSELVDDKLLTYAPAAPEGSITKVVRLVSYNYKTKAYKVLFEEVASNATSDKSLFAQMEENILYCYYDAILYRFRLHKGIWDSAKGINLQEIYEPALVYDESFGFDDTSPGEPISPNQIQLEEMIAVPSRQGVFLKFKLSRNDTTAWRYLFVLYDEGQVYVPRFLDSFAADLRLYQLSRNFLFAYNDFDYHPPGAKVRKLSIIGYVVDMREFVFAPDPEEYLPLPTLDLSFADTDRSRQTKAEHQVVSFISNHKSALYTHQEGGLARYQVYSYPMGGEVNFSMISFSHDDALYKNGRSDYIHRLELDVIPTADNSFVTLEEDFYYCGTEGVTKVENTKKLTETVERRGVFYYLLSSNIDPDKAIAIGFETATAPPARNEYATAPLYHMAEAQVVELAIES